MLVQQFLAEIQRLYATGQATEHSYRPAIQALIDGIDPGVSAINEPKRVACGAPDFIINRGGITIGHIEAKDVPVDIRHLKDANRSQQERYLKALPNLIYTNGLDFDFYRDGERVHSVEIADFVIGIQPHPENFDQFENLLREFVAQRPQTITSTRTLAKMMAGKALLIKDVLANILKADAGAHSELLTQYEAFKENLIHDITPEDFADIYAETIAYGMFAARLHDPTTEDFSRFEALERLPKTYPFLRSLFTYIAGQDLDDRLRWIIDELAKVFQACDLHELMNDFGRLSGRDDPFLHFYEVFLTEYNPAKRKARGVWYTPEPVVNFIVRAVDDVLQTEFGLPLGLADTSKVTIDWDTGQPELTKNGKPTKSGKNATIKKEVHRVQILDPATGTGTFLAEVIKQIAPKVKGMAEGMWSGYIEKDLIPRLHGFELLMASYAMCHMKLDMILTELGYKPSANPPRLSVYLTNSLEEGEPANQSLPFAQWLAREVKEANAIKRDMPIMVVIGNPPYSGLSQNMSNEWIVNLIEDYKYVDGVHFGERKHWLHDDYVKFIRFAEYMIEKNGEGIVGFVTNHGFLDNPTFRGMRWHLLRTFDKIYVLDLHGSTIKHEVSPDGSSDSNVFDIQPGVSILIAVRNPQQANHLASVNRRDFWGDRSSKYVSLRSATIHDGGGWSQLEVRRPLFSFGHTNFAREEAYMEGFHLPDLMRQHNVGLVTSRDHFTIKPTKAELENTLRQFLQLDDETARRTFHLRKDVQSWSVASARKDVQRADGVETPIAYRPFDNRWTYYSGRSNGFLARPIFDLMRHFLAGPNISLAISKQQKASTGFFHILAHKNIIESSFTSNRTSEITSSFPLYLYPEDQDLDQSRRVNFDDKIYAKIREAAKDEAHGEPDELTVFDYIYGVLHCPAYREAYAGFLKFGFPRIPYPLSPDVFWSVSAKGTLLRRLHLMEPDSIGDAPYPFKGDADNTVEKPIRDESGRVWINRAQYFEDVPEIAWGFHIGGYQPAQKWLKDRRGRALRFEDVLHYQRIIKVLCETDRIMKTIEMPLG